ncbi:hypothetical protein AURDEDRAFT_127380 [Auricularia subglabra TFB-10046 SS5]|uniref:Uncharacterized protein n=1 Tax=Auricularia subglabra (strain TFB-10046 / SS5) TaxID=717982 RepID=J0D2M1_AURST|nr:hypothetical protein AURDEDRAFT_127380 [Auricularia subglabra TFB-10046 SS5]
MTRISMLNYVTLAAVSYTLTLFLANAPRLVEPLVEPSTDGRARREGFGVVLLLVAVRMLELHGIIVGLPHGLPSLEYSPARSSSSAVGGSLPFISVEQQNGAPGVLRLCERPNVGVRHAAHVPVAPLLKAARPPVVDEPLVHKLNVALVALPVEPFARVLVPPFPRRVDLAFERALEVSSGSAPNVAHGPPLVVSIDPPVDVPSVPVRDAVLVTHLQLLEEPPVRLLNERLMPLPIAPFALLLVQPSACAEDTSFHQAPEGSNAALGPPLNLSTSPVLDAVHVSVVSLLKATSALVVVKACIPLLKCSSPPVSKDVLVRARDVTLEPTVDPSCPPVVDAAHVPVVRLPDDLFARVLAALFSSGRDASVSFPRWLDLSFTCLLDLSFVDVPVDSFARVPDVPLARVPEEPFAPLPDPALFPLVNESLAPPLREPLLRVPLAPQYVSPVHLVLDTRASIDEVNAQRACSLLPAVVVIDSAFARSSDDERAMSGVAAVAGHGFKVCAGCGKSNRSPGPGAEDAQQAVLLSNRYIALPSDERELPLNDASNMIDKSPAFCGFVAPTAARTRDEAFGPAAQARAHA